MTTDGQRTKWHRNIAENFSRLSRVHERYTNRQTTARSRSLKSVSMLPGIFRSYVANRVTDKLTKVTDKIYCCRSGSAADTQAIADIVAYELSVHQ